MTIFMKFEVITYFIMRVFDYLLCFVGALFIVGLVGSYELNNITDIQFLVYELQAFSLVGIGLVSSYFRKAVIRKDFIRRRRQLAQ